VLILDTDVLSILQRGTGSFAKRLVQRLDESADTDVCVAIVTFEEQMRGWLALIAKAANAPSLVSGYYHLHALVDDFNGRPLLDYDDRAASIFLRLRREKVRIGTMDLRIAAIALAHDATLISKNVAHFSRVPDLRVEDWTE
jgi:tRNA(fMet)-specific endonuclease VapC